MDARLDDDDWKEVFGAAGERGGENYGEPSAARFDDPVSLAPFTREDVAEILAIEDGENDGPEWIGVFRLRDGRFAFCSGGCDYTGWECQSSADAKVATDVIDLIAFAVDDEQERRLAPQLLVRGLL